MVNLKALSIVESNMVEIKNIQASFQDHLRQFELPNVKFTGEKLGDGSYGCVEIVDIPGASCAAKILHDSLVQNMPSHAQRRRKHGYTPRSLLEGFKVECTLMSRLRHPHIVQFLGICYPKDKVLPALVMELLDTSLHDYLESEVKADRTIPMAVKLSILLDISKGLVFLHSMDIVHRDLTATNVLLSESLTAKIADLGMARLLKLQAGRRAATMTKAPGSANYMPPEACGEDEYVAEYGKPIDSFSMGQIILVTTTQEFLSLRGPKYLDSITGRMLPRTEIERRAESFRIFHELIGEDHPLTRLAVKCLHDDPNKRPTAPEIMQQMEQMPTVPYRMWGQSRSELIHQMVELENTVSELQVKELTQQSLAYQHSRQEWQEEREELLGVIEDLQRVNLSCTETQALMEPDQRAGVSCLCACQRLFTPNVVSMHLQHVVQSLE